MRIKPILLLLTILTLLPTRAPAGTIWNWTHEASGSGSANVFDGGPTDFENGTTTDPSDHFMVFLASDDTMPGSFGASALAGGRSHIIEATDEVFRLRVDLLVGYFPSGFPGGDNPGGMAQGELTSVIEFTMPADELQWFHQLLIDEDTPFEGQTRIVVENATRSELLLELSSEVLSTESLLFASQGDLIRITSEIWGLGNMGPGSVKEYQSVMEMLFIVPEPGSLALLVTAIVVFPAEIWRRRGAMQRNQQF